jgi:hypothetical protein
MEDAFCPRQSVRRISDLGAIRERSCYHPILQMRELIARVMGRGNALGHPGQGCSVFPTMFLPTTVLGGLFVPTPGSEQWKN